MSSSAQRNRPAIWGPVLVAAVFLAIIGGSAGWALGTRAEAEERRVAQEFERQQARDQGGVPVVESPGAGRVPGDGYTDGGDQPNPARPPSADSCPDVTARLARAGSLSLRLYLRTASYEVWICAAKGDRLFYQGHRGEPGEPLVDGENALFLTDVREEGDGYLATNASGPKTTTYRVSRDELVISNDGAEAERESAV